MPNSFGNHVTDIENFSSPAAPNCRKFPKNLGMSRQLWEVAETKISAGPSRVTGPAELNEMVQYVTSFIINNNLAEAVFVSENSLSFCRLFAQTEL
jgi:hypothetical protein